MDIDGVAQVFADECAKAGCAGFAIRCMEDGNVRLIGPSLPVALVARMLRAAADVYEQTSGPDVLN